MLNYTLVPMNCIEDIILHEWKLCMEKLNLTMPDFINLITDASETFISTD